MVSNGGEVLANGLTSALVVGFSQDRGPTVLEEVERCLAVKAEHSDPVGRVHAISQELHGVARDSLTDMGHSLDSF